MLKMLIIRMSNLFAVLFIVLECPT